MTSAWFAAADGTRLHVIDAGPRDGSLIPLLCLPGLTRNHRDFEPVFRAFSADRRIIAVDFRGRGNSQWADPKSYTPQVELADTIGILDQLNVARVAVLGSSRGGIVGMLMGALHPHRLAGLMLNDIGPVIEVEGLKRIADYVGKAALFDIWDDAALSLAAHATGFANVTHEQWVAVAKRIYGEKDGRPCSEHDPGLALNFPSREKLDAKPLPDTWVLFDTLPQVPLAALRGAGSDLFSDATLSAMCERRTDLAATPVPDRGHIPFLDEPASVDAIAAWLTRVVG